MFQLSQLLNWITLLLYLFAVLPSLQRLEVITRCHVPSKSLLVPNQHGGNLIYSSCELEMLSVFAGVEGRLQAGKAVSASAVDCAAQGRTSSAVELSCLSDPVQVGRGEMVDRDSSAESSSEEDEPAPVQARLPGDLVPRPVWTGLTVMPRILGLAGELSQLRLPRGCVLPCRLPQ